MLTIVGGGAYMLQLYMCDYPGVLSACDLLAAGHNLEWILCFCCLLLGIYHVDTQIGGGNEELQVRRINASNNMAANGTGGVRAGAGASYLYSTGTLYCMPTGHYIHWK